MAWLTWASTVILDWLKKALVDYFSWLIIYKAREKREEGDNARVGDNLQKGETKEERDRAAEDVINNW